MAASESTVVCVLIEKLAAILGTAEQYADEGGVVSREWCVKKHIFVVYIDLGSKGACSFRWSGQVGSMIVEWNSWRVPTGFGVADVQCRCLVPGENVALQLERAFVAWPQNASR